MCVSECMCLFVYMPLCVCVCVCVCVCAYLHKHLCVWAPVIESVRESSLMVAGASQRGGSVETN